MVEKTLDPDAKRRRLETEQKAAFNEDMARVRAAIDVQNSGNGSAAPCDGGGGYVEQSQIGDGEAVLQPFSQQQQPAMNTLNGDRNIGDSDDEEEGNWLKNFTSHHTRVGEDFQVMNLPLPSRNKKVLN